MRCPLPSFKWANETEVWSCMLEKDITYSKLRSERLLEQHPSLVKSFRTILFDWLSEVSHECKFHRETYHLALDFIDRYLAATRNVSKYQLQLIGTTCLFLAAKYEEIRPPTVIEFAELTDGACKPEDIIDNEVVVLSAIGWDITPMTPNSWLNTYMLNLEQQAGLVTGETSKHKHKRIASLIDLALLHIESLRFRNSILTAAAIYHFTTEATVRQCSGYSYEELADCIHWLEPFFEVIRAIEEPIFVALCKSEANPTQMHTHIASAKLLEQVDERLEARRHLRLQSAALKRKAYCLAEEDADDEASNEVSSAGGVLERMEARVTRVLGQHSEVNSNSPEKPSTTVLLTPPRSTSKARKHFKRHHHAHHQKGQPSATEESPSRSPLPPSDRREFSTFTHVRRPPATVVKQ